MGIVTPLQLIAVTGLLNNQGLKPLPAALTTALNQYNATTVMQNFFAAVSFYKAQSFFTESTFDLLMSIGSTVCPALGNSIPTAPIGTYPNLIAEYLTINTVVDNSTIDPSGFTNLIEQTGSAYLGNGDVSKFAQGFLAVQGYVSTVNSFINSVNNSQTYLGPTFTTMSNLTTNNISQVTTDIPSYANDLRNTGQLINLKNLDLYGTPAGLLQQVANAAGIVGGSLPAVITSLRNQSMTDSQIRNLITNNRVGLFNPNGLSAQEFDQLQKLAYQAMTQVTGQDLQDVLTILDISTPNINSMADLLNPAVIYPNSYKTLQTPTPYGPQPIFLDNGAVNLALAPIINQTLPTPSGCDELGKIIPPEQAVANKAIQSSLQQITNIGQTVNTGQGPAPSLATAMVDSPRTPWDPTVQYLTNDTVALAPASPAGPAQLLPDTVFYRAQQDVPIGVNISDTNYWQPYTPSGLNTMADLPLIEALTSAVPATVATSFNNQNATGTGPNGTITICDVIGTAVDHWDFASRLSDATTQVNALQTAGSLTALNNAYVAILAAASDAAVLTQITNANNAISALSASPYVTLLNTDWTYIANYLNKEKGYQNQAGIDYFQLVADNTSSVYALAQSLSQYGPQSQACGPNQFLQEVADTSTLTGQAVVGSLRESQNQSQLNRANLSVNITPSAGPELIPDTAVPPVT